MSTAREQVKSEQQKTMQHSETRGKPHGCTHSDMYEKQDTIAVWLGKIIYMFILCYIYIRERNTNSYHIKEGSWYIREGRVVSGEAGRWEKGQRESFALWYCFTSKMLKFILLNEVKALATKTDNRSSVSRTHTEEGESRYLQASLWSPHVHHGM